MIVFLWSFGYKFFKICVCQSNCKWNDHFPRMHHQALARQRQTMKTTHILIRNITTGDRARGWARGFLNLCLRRNTLIIFHHFLRSNKENKLGLCQLCSWEVIQSGEREREGGTRTNYRHWFTSRLPYGRLSLPVRFQVIQGIASIAMYFGYRRNPISASVKARGETGILISGRAVQSLGL